PVCSPLLIIRADRCPLPVGPLPTQEYLRQIAFIPNGRLRRIAFRPERFLVTIACRIDLTTHDKISYLSSVKRRTSDTLFIVARHAPCLSPRGVVFYLFRPTRIKSA